MRFLFLNLLFLGALGLCLAAPRENVRWCTISQPEATKCSKWQKNMEKIGGPSISCVRKKSTRQCMDAIVAKKADAMTLNVSLLLEAGLDSYKLRPIAAEVYGTEAQPQTHVYAVAVVKSSSSLQLNQLRGARSCHSGLGEAAGWTIPLGLLRLSLNWKGPPEPLEAAVAKFFSSSCVPGADRTRFPNLCHLCAGTRTKKCAFSSQEPYFGNRGAFKCLRDGAGDVAFMQHSTLLEVLTDAAKRDQYKLLCPDNTWKPVHEYKQCHLSRVPSRAVVARSEDGREDSIWQVLRQAQESFGKQSSEFKLFGSPGGQKNLLFKDFTIGFLRVPPKIDAKLYLGSRHITAFQNLKESEEEVAARSSRISWCAVGSDELRKCERWSHLSQGKVICTAASTTEDCLAAILKAESDGMSLDGGFIYTAGRCGLVPVLAENQKSTKSNGSDCVNRPPEGYLAVALVMKENADITWNSLEGKKSCHTAVGRTAGWNIPIGLLFNQTGSCKFGEFFSQSCAPGSEPTSSLCALCVGDEMGQHKCAANSSERYFGYTGALRCLVEKSGDVAFVKDSTIFQNAEGKNTEAWARDLKLEDYELLCLDGSRKPVTEARSCHLAMAPNHAVVSRSEKAKVVEKVLLEQQILFGRTGQKCPGEFCLFQSDTKNLLFNDNTECLARLQGKTTYVKFLGQQYVTATTTLTQCSTSPLLDACAFLEK
ncbi:lactotransferrin [Dipodomys spectabilis]|uniref:lactotransferrin n=1 Tax=Dipodomys spectabilis TaxID=105255 RepID=UPI001C53C3F0|nr:lactotransferrin [Dipodomys spectabilis]